ncbi:MAG: macro domain-containing protein, partial [Trueperaceae bacterium]|nr:macro domain-containing protein [Trueperaceae bacterium]
NDPTGRPPERTRTVPRDGGGAAEVRLVMGDLTEAAVDAIVNPTNPSLHGTGRSVDGAVHRRGGRGLTRACRALGRLDVGRAAVTRGYDLPARYVLHVATAPFEGRRSDLARLEAGWRDAFALATQMHLRHLAVPAMGLGSNAFPPDAAARIALAEVVAAASASDGPDRVDVVAFDVGARDALADAFDADVAPVA